MKRQTLVRWGVYLAGCVLLALGVTLTTKTGLGTGPIVSLSYCVSQLTGQSFAVMTFILYSLCALAQFPVKGKDRNLRDLWQIPFSLGFSWLLGRFGALLPMLSGWGWRFGGMAIAIVCTGLGLAAMVSMKIIANPADSLADAIGTASGKGMGLAKNFLDITCVALAVITGLVFGRRVIGVGVGTLCAMIFVGRVVAVYNRFLKPALQKAAGIE